MNGHETVKGRILENFFLAGQFQATGIPARGGRRAGMEAGSI